MSYYTKPRPGTVGDNLHSGTSSLLDQLMNLRNPNAPRSVFEASPAQMEGLNEKKAVAADADARAEKEWRAKRMAQQDANIRRAQGLPPLPVESTAQVPPESVMSAAPAPEELMSSAQNFTPAAAAKDESGPVNMPVRDLGIVPVPPLAAGSAESGKKSSTLRSQASKGAPVEAAVAAAPTEQAAAAPAIAEMLSGKLTTAEGDRDSAKARALAAKDMNDGEKIFTALMAVMPGLIGAIGGGAIAGGAGAAAGAAGGLNGGAGAIGAMMGEKEQLRQEALGQEAAAQQRMDQVGNQQLGHAEKLQGQDFQVGERKAGEQFTVAGREDQQAFNAEQDRKHMAQSDRHLLTKLKHDHDMQQAQFKERIAASASSAGVELKEYQGKAASFAATMLQSKKDLDEMRDPSLWNTMATWGGYRNAVADPKRQKYARAVFNFLDAVSRDVSGAAITPTDWETKFHQYMALQGSSPSDLDAAQDYRDVQTRMMLEKAGPGARMAIDAVQQLRPAAPPASMPPEVMSSAQQWLQANPNDPDAPAIRARLGVK